MAHLFKVIIWELLPRAIIAAFVMLGYFLYFKYFPNDPLRIFMTPEEEEQRLLKNLETQQQQQQVKVIPRYDCSTKWLNSKDFQPDHPDWYPIWIALNFRHQGRCKLIPPSWLNRDELWRIQEAELRSDMFAKMTTERYISMAMMFFDTCPKDMFDEDDLMALVWDIFEARRTKLRKAKAKLIGHEDEDEHLVSVPDSELTQAELCPNRSLFPKALHRFRKTVRVTPIDGKRDPSTWG